MPTGKRVPTEREKQRGARLCEARERAVVAVGRALNQAEMGEVIGKMLDRELGQSAWSNYETARTPAPIDVVEAAAELSGLNELYLMWGDGERVKGTQGALSLVPSQRPGVSTSTPLGRPADGQAGRPAHPKRRQGSADR